MNIWRLIFPKKEEEPEEEAVEIVVEDIAPEPVETALRKTNNHDERATAAEEALAKAMADLESDDFDERVQNIAIGTQSLNAEQIKTMLRDCEAKSKPI